MFFSVLLATLCAAQVFGQVKQLSYPNEKLLAYWRFEQVQNLKGELTLTTVGEPLTADDRKPAGSQPFSFDESGNGNFLQVRGAKRSPNFFSDNVPASTVNGKANSRSLKLNNGEYFVNSDRPLPYADMQKSWTINASLIVQNYIIHHIYAVEQNILLINKIFCSCIV